MKQATKDRLFELGLRIPAAVEIRGDTAVQEWAAQAIALAEARGEGAPASDDLGASFAELVGNRGEPVNLLGLLRRINEAAIELAELCVAEGDDAVLARLGELPAWPHFRAWASEAFGTGTAAAEPEPEPEPQPEPGPQPEPAAVIQADGDPGEPEPVPEAQGDGEDAEAVAFREAEPDPGGTVASAEPASYAMELEAIKERLGTLEGLERVQADRSDKLTTDAVDHDQQISGLNAVARALEGRATALEEDPLSYAAEIEAIKERLAAQESQGADQWAGIEANTAARIKAHQAPAQDHAPAIDTLQERLTRVASVVDDNAALIGGLSAGLTALEVRVTAQQDPPAEPGPVAAEAEQPAAE